MALLKRRRRSDPKDDGALAILAKRYASPLIVFGVLATGFWGTFNYYAKAADVEKKFSSVVTTIEVRDLRAKRERYEDELFRLRLVKRPDESTRALINRYESKLNATDARLRDLERNER